MPKATKCNILTVMPMGMFLVAPDCDVLPGAVVVDRSLALRMASLRDPSAGGTSRSWCVQPSEDWTGGRVALPPGRQKRWAGRLGHSILLGVLAIGVVLKEGRRRHLREVVLLGLLGRGEEWIDGDYLVQWASLISLPLGTSLTHLPTLAQGPTQPISF